MVGFLEVKYEVTPCRCKGISRVSPFSCITIECVWSLGFSFKYLVMSFILTSYILIYIGQNRLLWRWYINIVWWISIIKTSPVMGQSYTTAFKTVRQFGVMVPFYGSYTTTITRQFKMWTISACWPMTHLCTWLSRSVCCSPSSIRTALTRMVLTAEATDNSQRIICLVNAGFLLLVVGGDVPGTSDDDVMISASVDTCFTISFVAPLPFNWKFFSAGLCPLACLLLYSGALWSEESALYSSLE